MFYIGGHGFTTSNGQYIIPSRFDSHRHTSTFSASASSDPSSSESMSRRTPPSAQNTPTSRPPNASTAGSRVNDDQSTPTPNVPNSRTGIKNSMKTNSQKFSGFNKVGDVSPRTENRSPDGQLIQAPPRVTSSTSPTPVGAGGCCRDAQPGAQATSNCRLSSTTRPTPRITTTPPSHAVHLSTQSTPNATAPSASTSTTAPPPHPTSTPTSTHPPHPTSSSTTTSTTSPAPTSTTSPAPDHPTLHYRDCILVNFAQYRLASAKPALCLTLVDACRTEMLVANTPLISPSILTGYFVPLVSLPLGTSVDY